MPTASRRGNHAGVSATSGRERRPRRERADDARGQRQQQAFDHQLRDDAGAALAERCAHRQLALTADRARQDQRRQIGARNQEDESHRGLEQQERLTHPAEERLLQRLQGQLPLSAIGKRTLVLARHVLDLRRCLLQRDARLEPGDTAQPPLAALCGGRSKPERYPRIG